MSRILGIVGNPEDLCATYLAWVAKRRGCEIVELPENELGVGWSYSFDDRHPERGEVTIGQRRIPFTAFAALIVRLDPQPRLPDVLDDVAPERQALFIVERRAGLQHWLATFPSTVVNRPSAGRANGSKPLQMRLLAEAGFRVPRWIASNDPRAIQRFLEPLPHGAVYKACSGLRSRVRRADEALLAKVQASTPLIVQEYIAGRDVRVHTVLRPQDGGRPQQGVAFPTEICSPAGVDYRWDPGEHAFAACELPEELAALCIRVATEEGLFVAGFDFRVTDDGIWHCLEVNPVPTFITYQAATHQPIGEAIIDSVLERAPLEAPRGLTLS